MMFVKHFGINSFCDVLRLTSARALQGVVYDLQASQTFDAIARGIGKQTITKTCKIGIIYLLERCLVSNIRS